MGQENSARLGLLLRERDEVGFLDGKRNLEVVAVNWGLKQEAIGRD